jgi:hypothetical protein
LANERLEGGLVNLFSFVDVDRAPCLSVETRVEERLAVLTSNALGASGPGRPRKTPQYVEISTG